MRAWWMLSGVIALVIGAGAASYVAWIKPAQEAIAGIVDADPHVRRASWAWLLAQNDDGARPRLEQYNDRLNRALQKGASDDALLDAASVLKGAEAWTWSQRGGRLIVGELQVRARNTPATFLDDTVNDIVDLPRDVDPKIVLDICQIFLERPEGDAWKAGLHAAAGWLGVDRAALLADLDLPDIASQENGDEPADRTARIALRRQWWLMRSWNSAAESPHALENDLPIDVLEAQLLFAVRASPDENSAALDVIDTWTRDDRPAFAHILRYAEDDRARAALERLARADDRAAQLVLAERSEVPETNSARRVAADREADPTLRRLAAWRLDRLGEQTVADILAADPLEPDGSAYATALLAERLLDRDAAVARSESWLRSLDPAFVRAGALLAALLGEHCELVEDSLDAHTDGTVRTTLRSASIALRRTHATDDDRAFLHRTMHRDDDRFNPEAALCLLMTGDTSPLEVLTATPRGEWRLTIQPRAWLIERLLPDWHARAGRPIGGDAYGYRLHFDQLDALRLLTQNRLAFDPQRCVFAMPSSAAD